MSPNATDDSNARDDGFSDQERAAIKDRAKELKTQAKRRKSEDKAAADEADLLAKIEQMPAGDREMAERLHSIVGSVAPDLAPKLYYGQPGYARKGKVICFFRSGGMDKARYSTFGFSPEAALDNPDGFWPTSYALEDPSEAAWEAIADLISSATA
ncbi:DUF1801 domain-containing protein [Brevibacterium aurantiacum]|uniref:DUF1801 domain-containing protein n=1 Tax=Brevibacterium aurantiacum TaxID=273384 RepID=A0A556CDG5_BREAU|nr:DUF1801 domain-containing protein [Brevibacterium aurantiacum]TSI15492.1 DUF1801 domain-containing protein [Brevibacterium aurantiacum]